MRLLGCLNVTRQNLLQHILPDASPIEIFHLIHTVVILDGSDVTPERFYFHPSGKKHKCATFNIPSPLNLFSLGQSAKIPITSSGDETEQSP